MNFDILILVFNTKREIAIKGEIELFNLIIIDESLYLTNIGIDEERN